MQVITKMIGMDSGIELESKFPGESQQDAWYNPYLVLFYKYLFKFLKYAWQTATIFLMYMLYTQFYFRYDDFNFGGFLI